ncbi:MAG TPA: replication-relaxation family protein [Candidatus Dormibacteraeota bacterium]|nr:replication-relaxation family protein [Candidatus Dormibacteraeota bacterium]
MKLSPITTKQQDILKLLYRYRFLNRIQIQALMGHKNNRRIAEWLKDLRDKKYVEWIYDGDNFVEKTKPAIYYLGLNGIRCLRTTDEFPPEELRKRYKESSRKQDFIDRCLLIADCCLTLKSKTTSGTQYTFVTVSDYTDPDSGYAFLSELQPQLCFIKKTARNKTAYLLEVFDPTTPRYMVKKRLNDYIAYLEDGNWESETEDDKPPVILIACPTIAELAYVKRRTRKLLTDMWDDETLEDIHIRFATIDKVKSEGVTGIIWEAV